MKTTEDKTNYAFRFYDVYDKLIDQLDGPGDIGIWLGGPDSPFYAAIIPANFEDASVYRNPELLTKTIRLPLDENGRPMESASEEIVMYEAEDIEDAKELAKELGCDYIYSIEWDVCRSIALVEVNDPESEPIDYYYLTHD